jgi:hypothetical protein
MPVGYFGPQHSRLDDVEGLDSISVFDQGFTGRNLKSLAPLEELGSLGRVEILQ